MTGTGWIEEPRAPSPLRGPLLASLVLHGAALALFWTLGLRAPETPELTVRMVRLGGGRNRPGWVDDRPKAAETRPETARPAEPEPRREPARAEAKPAPAAPPKAPAARPSEAPRETPVAPSTTTAEPRPATPAAEPPPAAEETAEPADAAASASAGAAPVPAGTIADDGAGPAGAGSARGASADPSARGVPGVAGYLSRLENAVQRQFRFPGTGSGRRAVYHFTVERDGRVANLELREASDVPGLDLAGRGAIQRAVLPPLPPGLDAPRLGVTYVFHDDREAR